MKRVEESILDKINNPDDVKKLDNDQLVQLAEELRKLIIEVVEKNGGHLASNLGAVELTLALMSVYDLNNDKLVWDVGHQCYAYKILTQRKQLFHTIRKFGGISGFPKISESPFDCYGTGHASTSISAAVGMAVARDVLSQKHEVIAVIGDGSLTGGLAWEGLNHASSFKGNITIIINDNGMSISENVGMVSEYLNKLVTAPVYNRMRDDVWELLGLLPPFLSKKARDSARRVEEGFKNLLVPTILFEELGFRYIGPVNGHDIKSLRDVFKGVKRLKGPKVVHVLTQKGRGYEKAEQDPEVFHGVGPQKTAQAKEETFWKDYTWTDRVSDLIVEHAEIDTKIVAITAAMPLGTGLDKFNAKFPDRFFDVGIAESHAAVFAAGLAASGLKPALVLYSTFLQRAFDPVVHDIALQKLPVSFFIDRGGLVGEDGPTHHGLYDINYLLTVPEIIMMSPADENDLKQMVDISLNCKKPSFLRYPREKMRDNLKGFTPGKVKIGESSVLKGDFPVAIVGVGVCAHTAVEVREMVYEKFSVKPWVINARFLKPFPENILGFLEDKKLVVTIEEASKINGFGACLSSFLAERGYGGKFMAIGVEDEFQPHGSRKTLIKEAGLDALSIFHKLSGVISVIKNG
ncbi:1-deoxy-D-xylulose-5-phosphate synthase [candidate division WOR-3 bacterium]|nr:1-deoxy-D-xylulose-5-phosphate synthase [candidate division WOR-3 bacterium]